MSSDVTRFVDFTSRIEARTAILEAEGETMYVVKLFVTRTDLNHPSIKHVYSYGVKLPYTRDDRRRVGYSRQEAGHIKLARDQFEIFAQSGLNIEVIGARNVYGLLVPGRLFAESLSLYKTAWPDS